MAVTSDLLAHMEDMDNVLASKAISSTTGALQNRALRALNRAQDYLEMVLARYPNLLVEVDDTTSTTANQEYSDLPARCKRVDAVWYIDSDTSRPGYMLDAIREPSGHRTGSPWPVFDWTSSTTGKPAAYWWERKNNRLYWDRDPDSAYTMRVVGFFGEADMTISPDSTFAYGDELIVPVAAVALEIFRFRTDDNISEVRALAESWFVPVVQQMQRAWPDQKGDLRGVFPAW